MAKIGNDNKNTTEYRFKTLIAGGIAGCAAKTIVAPLDRIKILFQTHHQHYIHYQNIRLGYWQALMEIQRNNGVRGLFRGHSATLLRIFPYAGVKFMAYEQFKNIIMPTKTHETSGRNFVCGALAGVCASFVTYPFDLIRTRVAFEVKSIPLREVTVNIYREGGVSAFFQGISPTLIGMVISVNARFRMLEYHF